MRGALVACSLASAVFGIIPAYAGSTSYIDPGLVFNADHPRVCGEHIEDFRAAVRNLGSSPRMRGALNDFNGKDMTIRIIPAYAGSTVIHWIKRCVWGDHPRVCGEHFLVRVKRSLRVGSSPRMRGARSLNLHPA